MLGDVGDPVSAAVKRSTSVRRLLGGVLGVALALLVVGLTGCGVINDVKTIADAIRSNRSTIDVFTTKLKAGESTTFEATYVTTNSSPTTVIYAVDPPKRLAFSESSALSGGTPSVDLIINPSGEDACTPHGSSSWDCRKLPPASAADQNRIFAFYTPSHWVQFLRGLSLAAAFAGDRVTSSNMTLNGFKMQCVNFHASGVPGVSTICSTPQGILGYVKFATDSTRFELERYSGSPSPSLFEPPAGATFVSP